MAMQEQRPSALGRAFLADSEDLLASIVERALCGELIDPSTGFETGIELDARLRPQESFVELASNVRADPGVPDRHEALCVAAVIADELFPQCKDVHPESYRISPA